MIKYNAKDIIKRAEQIADLENSSFISWNENISLINEAYRKLYQTIIDSNDKCYLNSIPVSGLVATYNGDKEARFVLPDDFYQLFAVQSKSNQTPLLRKATSEPLSAKRYDIVNNELIIYGGADQEELELSYFPVPEALTLKAPEYVITSLPEGTILDCNGNKYLGFTKSENIAYLWIYDISNDKKKEFQIDLESSDYNIFQGTLGKKAVGLTIVNEDEELINNVLYDLVNNTEVDANDYTFAKADNNFYAIKKEDDYFQVYKENDLVNKYGENVEIVLPEDRADFTAWTFSSDLSFFYIIENETIYECDKYEAKPVLKTTSNKIEVIRDHLYSVNSDILLDGEILINSDEFYNVIGFNKVDDNTGYGITVCNEDDEYVVKSCFVDTILNFPNNFYFNYISFMLAAAYKIKQGADASGVLTQAAEEKSAFYDMMNRDVSNFVRITNVYGNGMYY